MFKTWEIKPHRTDDYMRELIREWALEAITNRGKHKKARRLRSIARNKKITRKQR